MVSTQNLFEFSGFLPSQERRIRSFRTDTKYNTQADGVSGMRALWVLASTAVILDQENGGEYVFLYSHE